MNGSQSALGFTTVPRRFQPRDSHFTGASNNPSKKGPIASMKRVDDSATYISNNTNQQPSTLTPIASQVAPPLPIPPPSQVAPTSATLLDRKCEFLENQWKRVNATVQELVDAKNAVSVTNDFLISATVESDTYEFEEESETSLLTEGTLVLKDQKVNIMYPMKRKDTADGYRLLMRRIKVDPNTCQLSSSWLVVFEEKSGAQSHLVNGFALSR